MGSSEGTKVKEQFVRRPENTAFLGLLQQDINPGNTWLL